MDLIRNKEHVYWATEEHRSTTSLISLRKQLYLINAGNKLQKRCLNMTYIETKQTEHQVYTSSLSTIALIPLVLLNIAIA